MSRIAYQNGQHFYFGIGVRNGGPLPVTMTGLRSDAAADDGTSIVHETVWVAPNGQEETWLGGPGAGGGGEPMHSFSLAPGRSRWVVFDERFGACPPDLHLDPSGSSGLTEFIYQVEVAYRVLGVVPRHGWMPLFNGFQIERSKPSQCEVAPAATP